MTGCGIWPAYWIYGPSWPNHGEVDIIEMIDLASNNQISLHTNASCQFNVSDPEIPYNFTGNWGQNTQVHQCVNDECGIVSDNNQSFGIPFNEAKGGYVAFLWDNTENGGFYSWFWNRNDPNMPEDVTTDTPNPAGWGEPVAMFPFGKWCPYNMFDENALVVNIDFCGWASQEFEKECPNTGAYNCVNYVAENPQAFVDAYWIINSIKVFQLE